MAPNPINLDARCQLCRWTLLPPRTQPSTLDSAALEGHVAFQLWCLLTSPHIIPLHSPLPMLSLIYMGFSENSKFSLVSGPCSHIPLCLNAFPSLQSLGPSTSVPRAKQVKYDRLKEDFPWLPASKDSVQGNDYHSTVFQLLEPTRLWFS